MRKLQNYKVLFGRIASWLAPTGLLFFHIFVHARGLPYHYEVWPVVCWDMSRELQLGLLCTLCCSCY